MTRIEPTNAIGLSINAWDQFYQKHFDWVYKNSLALCHNTLKAKELTDRIFVKILLAHPEYIVDDNQKALLDELAILFPYLGAKVNPEKPLSAGRFLHLYYHPN